MNLKEFLLYLLFCAILIIIGIYSFINGESVQMIFFVAFSLLILINFFKYKKDSKNLCISVSIISIFTFTVLYLYYIQNYNLEHIIPSLGGLTIVLYYYLAWDKTIIMRESLSLLKEYRMEEALPYLNKILESEPQSFYALYNKGAALNQMGKYNEALKINDEILKNKPKNVFALNMKSHLLIKLKRQDEALKIIEGILKKDPKNEFVIANKALALSRQEKYEESLMYFENAIKRISTGEKWKFIGSPMKTIITPEQLAEIWYEKGIVHQRLDQYNEALECFDHALELDPYLDEAVDSEEEVITLLGI